MKHATLNLLSILRSPANLRPVHLKTLFRLLFIVLLGGAGLSANADLEKGLAAYEKGDYTTALREWKHLAEQGNASAQFNLGVMYDNGKVLQRMTRWRHSGIDARPNRILPMPSTIWL